MIFRLPYVPPAVPPKLTAGEVAYHRDEPIYGIIGRVYHNGFASCIELVDGQWDYVGKWKRTQGECRWQVRQPPVPAGDRAQRAQLIFWWSGLLENYNAGAAAEDQVSEYAFYLLCRDDHAFKAAWAPNFNLTTLDPPRLNDSLPGAGSKEGLI